jgi:hypothetical protein
MGIVGRKYNAHISLDNYWMDEGQEAYRQEQNGKLRERKRDRFGQDERKKKEKKERFEATTNKSGEKLRLRSELHFWLIWAKPTDYIA